MVAMLLFTSLAHVAFMPLPHGGAMRALSRASETHERMPRVHVRMDAARSRIPMAATMAPSAGDVKGRVLVVGSINVDLYQRLEGGQAKFSGTPLSIAPIKGMTLPAASFVGTPAVKADVESAGLVCTSGEEEGFVLTMDGPFTQKTGGKGANAASAAGQTYACEFIGNMGAQSESENKALLADLKAFGNVDVARSATLPHTPTGTAYILLFDDNDNAIVLLGGANQKWPDAEALRTGEEGAKLRAAIEGSVCVMLQREVPEYVNVVTAELARAARKPVFMDVGGTDAPLDEALIPLISVIAPNESELTFISGVETKVGGKLDGKAIRTAVAALKAKFAKRGNERVEVLVTLGGLGSCHFGKLWCPHGTMTPEASAHETRVGCFALGTAGGKPMDTCGAGDCFRGSYVGARYGEGRGVVEAMTWAAAAGSLSVEVEGAMPSMPSRQQIAQRAKEKMLPLPEL